MHDKVPSTKYKDQTLSQSKFDDRTKSERIKDSSHLFPRMFFKQSPFFGWGMVFATAECENPGQYE
jgi:hypothetical protein